MQGVVILDGPDAAGKTTLANRLVEMNGQGSVHHLTYVKGAAGMFRLNYMTYWTAMVHASRGSLVIIDRGWMSENIYASVYRGGSALRFDVRGLDRALMRMGAAYVICAPEPKSAVERLAKAKAEREEMYEPDERALAVASRFRALYPQPQMKSAPVVAAQYDDYVNAVIQTMAKTGPRWDFWGYDIDKCEEAGGIDAVAQGVLRRVEWHNSQLAPWLGHNGQRRNFVGNWQGDVLFVGDKTNPKKSRSGLWPFVDFGASSRTISIALHNIGFDERRGMWTNANDNDGHLDEILAHCKHIKHVVALGKEAAKTLLDYTYDIPTTICHHPSYARRFNKVAELITQLQVLK
jgi:thymidylate kinase